MEDGAGVTEPFFTSTQSTEVFCGFRDNVVIKFEGDLVLGHTVDGGFKEDLGTEDGWSGREKSGRASGAGLGDRFSEIECVSKHGGGNGEEEVVEDENEK